MTVARRLFVMINTKPKSIVSPLVLTEMFRPPIIDARVFTGVTQQSICQAILSFRPGLCS
jgi:hypothetical protein